MIQQIQATGINDAVQLTKCMCKVKYVYVYIIESRGRYWVESHTKTSQPIIVGFEKILFKITNRKTIINNISVHFKMF